jgi:hypothetical protein
MSDTFKCGDVGALVAYLYGECEPSEHETIAAHLKRCVSCAGEISGLGATRRTLASWIPPETALGFQITRTEDVARQASVLERPKVVKPVRWWSAPLPAWAQAAAALVIFAAGMSFGLARNGSSGQAGRVESAVTPSAVSATPVSVSRADLSQLEKRLRDEMALFRSTPAAAAAAPVNQDAVMRQVKSLLEESEERQRRDFTLRMVEQASAFEQQRRVDLASVRTTMGQSQGAIGTEVRQQREAIDRINRYLVNVSDTAR